MPRSGVVGLESGSISGFPRKCHIDFHSGWANMYPRQCMRVRWFPTFVAFSCLNLSHSDWVNMVSQKSFYFLFLIAKNDEPFFKKLFFSHLYFWEPFSNSNVSPDFSPPGWLLVGCTHVFPRELCLRLLFLFQMSTFHWPTTMAFKDSSSSSR